MTDYSNILLGLITTAIGDISGFTTPHYSGTLPNDQTHPAILYNINSFNYEEGESDLDSLKYNYILSLELYDTNKLGEGGYNNLVNIGNTVLTAITNISNLASSSNYDVRYAKLLSKTQDDKVEETQIMRKLTYEIQIELWQA